MALCGSHTLCKFLLYAATPEGLGLYDTHCLWKIVSGPVVSTNFDSNKTLDRNQG